MSKNCCIEARVLPVQRGFQTLIAAIVLLGAGGAVQAETANRVAATNPQVLESTDSANDRLLKKLQAMEQRIQSLEAQLKKKGAAPAAQPVLTPAGSKLASTEPNSGLRADTAPATSASPSRKLPKDENKGLLGLVDLPVPGLSIGAYGEVKFGAMQNPAANGQWQNGFDAHRLVLLPTYAITPNIIFNAEIEFEHGGIAFDADDKFHGTAEVEQIWVDFKIVDAFNWRSPGIDLVPLGYINLHHEPTQFYSVNRPELARGLIPSTFIAPATSAYGRIADGLKYQIQVSTSIEDFGDEFDKRTDANTVPPFPNGYAAGITGLGALNDLRPVKGDFRQLSNDIAVTGRLDYAPPLLPGFAGSTAVYFTPNTTSRGAYSDIGNPLGRSSLTIFDTEFRYRFPNAGFETRAEYVRLAFGNPENLRANNDTDPTNNVGKNLYGYSGEIAYHFPLGSFLSSDWEAVPFYRYTYQNLQTNGFAGTDLNAPTGAGQQWFHTAGVAIFPAPQIVLKATYQRVHNRDSDRRTVGFVSGRRRIFL